MRIETEKQGESKGEMIERKIESKIRIKNKDYNSGEEKKCFRIQLIKRRNIKNKIKNNINK